MKRALPPLVLACVAVILPALPASAGYLDGDCIATAVSGTSYREDGSQLDAKTVATATEAEPFRIDPSGSVAWEARSEVPIENNTWGIGLVIGGIEVQFYSGRDANSARTTESIGQASIKERLAQMEWVLEQLNGKFEAWGRINGDGGAGCDGRAWVEIDGSFGMIGLVGAGIGAVGATMLAAAGMKKRA